jgi:hypothetical protein
MFITLISNNKIVFKQWGMVQEEATMIRIANRGGDGCVPMVTAARSDISG